MTMSFYAKKSILSKWRRSGRIWREKEGVDQRHIVEEKQDRGIGEKNKSKGMKEKQR